MVKWLVLLAAWRGGVAAAPSNKPIDKGPPPANPEADLDPGAVDAANATEAIVPPEPEPAFPRSLPRRPVTLPAGIEAGIDLALVRTDEHDEPTSFFDPAQKFVSTVARVKVGTRHLEAEGALEMFLDEIDPQFFDSEPPRGVRGGYLALRYAPSPTYAAGVDFSIVHSPARGFGTTSVQLYLPRFLGTVRARASWIALEATGFLGAGFLGEDFEISDGTDTVLVVGSELRAPIGAGPIAIEPRVAVALVPRDSEATAAYGVALVISPTRTIELSTRVERREDSTLFVVGLTGRYLTASLDRY